MVETDGFVGDRTLGKPQVREVMRFIGISCHEAYHSFKIGTGCRKEIVSQS